MFYWPDSSPLWTFDTLHHHAMSFLLNTGTSFIRQRRRTLCTYSVHVCICASMCVCVCAWQTPGPAPCSSSQDKGTPSRSRQRVYRQSEHTDKLCRLMAHQTVTRSPDNARSAVQPQKKKKKKTQKHRERLYLKCRMLDVTQDCSTRCMTWTGCHNGVINVCVWRSDEKLIKWWKGRFLEADCTVNTFI